MIRVAVQDVEPGMVLAAPVPHPLSAHHTLLKAGHRLSVRGIRKLPRNGVRFIWVRHPGFDFLDKRLSPAVPESRCELYHHVRTSFTGIADRVAGSFDIAEYKAVVNRMIMNLVANRGRAVMAERLLNGPDELFAHSANTTYLALVLGMELDAYIVEQRRYVAVEDARDLTNLGIGAMLHDLGKLGFGKSCRGTHVIENEMDDADSYRTHPSRGYKALRGRIEATAAAIVLHHHQRYDGCGFPEPTREHKERRAEPIKGNRIHVFARITAVADAIDALVARSEAEGKPTVAALAELQSSAFEGAFDPVVVRAALRCIPPFAVGTCVGLSDRRAAVVIDTHSDEPCKPTVQIVTPEAAQDDAGGEELDLAASGAPSIAFVGSQPVGEYLYNLPPADPAGRAETPELVGVSGE